MTDLIGQTLGQYQILRELGRGGMAVVYEAYQPSLNRHVAIKVLPPQLALDRTFVSRFMHEARAAARLEHPNIVTIHDVGEHRGQYFIVMQLLTGETLNALIGRVGRLPPERAGHILRQIASALDYAHAHGIVHRDIKPANIIVGPGDQATLTDFGIAKAAAGAQLTQTGTAVGTPEYMSPEQAAGKPVGPASDVYSLAIVLYQMLAGQVPFRADSAPAILHKHVYEAPRPVRALVPQLPPAVDGVLAHGLAKEPTARFASASAMAQAFTAATAGGPTVQAPAATFARGGALAGRPKWQLAAGGALLVVVIGILIALLAGASGQGSPTPTSAPSTPSGTPAATVSPGQTQTPNPVSSATLAPPSSSAAPPQVVASQVVNVYERPATGARKLGQIAQGETKEIIGRNADQTWWRVCCVAGDPVWVMAQLVQARGDTGRVPVTASETLTVGPTTSPTLASSTRSPTSPPSPPPQPTAPLVVEITIIGGPVNVRSGPGTAYPPLGEAVDGATYRVTGRTVANDWVRFDYGGREGWVSAQFVTVRGQLAGVPVAQPPISPTPPPAPPAPACRGERSLPPVSLNAPRKDLTCNGPVRFTWQWSQALQAGEAFEIHIWSERQQNRAEVKRTRAAEVVVDLQREVRWINWNERPHRWEVVVVCEANGRWVSQESEPRLLYFDSRIPLDPNPDRNCK